jgi:16S rRNA A1518/A1519 N6-dimethyltransferase RsmA/KsgA/DIM1 with predicted DNA glycosylase/AP lyase activity
MKWSKRRSLGQHMLIDIRILAKVIEASQISKNEIVCEGGTGNGILTYELCKYAKSVISFEIDKVLFARARARKQACNLSNLQLLNVDLFKILNLKYNVFISNLPYCKSKDAFYWLPTQKFDRAIVMIQREFADKLQAKPGEKNYRAISVVTQHCFTLQKLFSVNKDAFDPQPSVESVVIKLIPRYHKITWRSIRNLNYVFSQRNKKASSVAKRFGINFDFGDTRIDELHSGELIKLVNLIEIENSI